MNAPINAPSSDPAGAEVSARVGAASSASAGESAGSAAGAPEGSPTGSPAGPPHVAVVGGGIAGLIAAWDLARAGATVALYEAGDRLGGAIGAHEMGGVAYDAGAEAFATRSPVVPKLLQELGLHEQVVAPQHSAAWLQLPDLAAPLPATGILGIPADPMAPDVVAILGEAEARRAAEDLTASMESWVQADAARSGQITLGEVVRDRMGQAVLDRLVTPIVSGVHSADPDDLDMNNAAPGLFEAMLREGSLARAVALVKSKAPPGSAVNSLHGGLNRLVGALEAELLRLGVELRLNTEVTDLAALIADEGPDHVILALDAPAAVQLVGSVVDLSGLDLTGLTPGGAQEAPGGAKEAPGGEHGAAGLKQGAAAPDRGVALVSMILDAPELDDHPRGTGVLVAPQVQDIAAKAMTHISSKWEWADTAVTHAHGPGHHVVRLSYGRVGPRHQEALGAESSDEQLLAAAAADIGALFGIPIDADQILEASVIRWRKALPQSSAGHAERITALRERLAEASAAGSAQESTAVQPSGERRPGLHMIGAWFAGTGLARVVPDARAAAVTILRTSR
ncbi:protoporphyrinogen oxidase [Nesterenkonia sp. AN1]|uniref:protoporphyrinogen/coproporphyrinogen oxidase n=1 Tax=Nesterenkonia sp. AN1 TaxID=652017 RepID=UPI000447D01F|nr:FAD-dependent oxidoreductase [Nesterenkonia sp. AN1]EXF25959.1 protoporphyrinogen oxidase [Nesterenkonia sp. AN1]